jgi:transaldolase
MPKSKIEELSELGQSLWLDYISRSLLQSGRLQELVGSGLRGLTSNPTIFDQAISNSQDYDEEIAALAGQGRSIFEIYDDLTIADIRRAADLFKGVYERTHANDGYVSLEIDPRLAHKTAESIEEGRRLFKKVARPNVMIKVPATPAGFPVISTLLSEGINVNVTLIFSLEQYQRTVEAFLKGLKFFAADGGDLKAVRSVASIFVSRIDTAVDKLLDEKMSVESDEEKKRKLRSLRGKAAVANSKIIFVTFKEIFSGEPFRALMENGAEVQRVLWGSTGTKNPDYSDIKYVTDLIGRPTVNTLPEKTLLAFLDHGVVKETLSEYAEDAHAAIQALRESGIDVDRVCDRLLAEGVAAFEKSFQQLLASIETKARGLAVK